MFGTNHKEQVTELEDQVDILISEKLILQQKLEDAVDITHTFADKEKKYQKQLLDSQLQLNKVKGTITNLSEAHKVELKAIETSVNRKINAALASIGVQRFASEQFTVPSNQSDLECYNTFMNLTGNEKTEYYRKNKDKIARVQLT